MLTTGNCPQNWTPAKLTSLRVSLLRFPHGPSPPGQQLPKFFFENCRVPGGSSSHRRSSPVPDYRIADPPSQNFAADNNPSSHFAIHAARGHAFTSDNRTVNGFHPRQGFD